MFRPWPSRAIQRLAKPVAGAASRMLDLLYPPLCPGCESVLLDPDATGFRPPLCDACEDRLEPLERPFCEICGQSYSVGGSGPFRCANCGGRRFAFDFAVAPFHAKGMLREMVHRFKFGKVMQLRKPLGNLLGRVLVDPRLHGRDWVLVPVPIHPRRLRHRTFNQSLELARVLAREKCLPLVHALRRAKFTPPQSRLSRDQRLENLRGAITPVPKAMAALAGRDVLLVDDIFTTGSTGQACASVLIANGVRKVVVITLARG